MASGDTLLVFHPYNNEPPSASYATLDTRNQHPALDFDAATSETVIFGSIMPQSYAGGGVEVYNHVAFSSATAGSAVLQVYFERIGNEQWDIDADGFGPNASLAVDVPFTSGSVYIASVNIANGASMDSVAAGELFRLKIQRDCENATDSATGDLELLATEIREL